MQDILPTKTPYLAYSYLAFQQQQQQQQQRYVKHNTY
jgi:hypothetical protein